MVSMAAFDLSEFVSDPSLNQLETCRKDDLFAIADHYGISVSTSLLKCDLKAVVVEGLISEGVFGLPPPVGLSNTLAPDSVADDGESEAMNALLSRWRRQLAACCLYPSCRGGVARGKNIHLTTD